MYYVDPIEWARELADGGAEWINVVDLDAGGKQVTCPNEVVRFQS
jgi:phosphoribosylformimino-5-aminoimidazole carboxamide ribonucleotide (ProFAR) isomerase